jgi:hypothetical protein
MDPTYREVFRILMVKKKTRGEPLEGVPQEEHLQTSDDGRLGCLQWAWWKAMVTATSYRDEETVLHVLELEAQLRCLSAIGLLSSASSSVVHSTPAKSAAAKFILRHGKG